VNSVRPQVSRSDLRLAELAAVGVMVIWAGNFVVVKDALRELPPVGFTMLRILLAAVALLVVLRVREGSVTLPRRDILPLAVLGAVGIGVYQTLWTIGLSYTTAGDSSLLLASIPIVTLLVAAAIGSDVLTPARLLGALVSFGGVALIVVSGDEGAFGSQTLGNVLTLIAAACWAGYVAFGAPVLRRHSPLRTTTWALFFGSLVLLPIGVWQLAGTDWSGVTAASPLAVLYAGLLSAAVGNVVHFRSVQRIGPSRTNNLQFLVPAIAVVLAAIFLAEQIRVEQVIGGVIIVLGILVARRTARPRLMLRGV
jgi:drug/metabolite transporter (DMT)-like permease